MTAAPPPRVVVCLDKFRGSATAAQASDAVAGGVRDELADTGADVVSCPVADGGEGTVEALELAGWPTRALTVRGPDGRPVRARFALDGVRAVVELAQAAGSALLARPLPRTATSYGAGELVRAALDSGCTDITLAVGGSATTDGGAGLLTALGARLRDGAGEPLGAGGAALADLDTVDLTTLDPRLAAATLQVATDVDNPLLGERGAARVFGPQKGATPRDVDDLERGLTRFADVMQRATGVDHGHDPGAGAAGGAGFAALAVLGATRVSGVSLVLDQLRLARLLATAALVVVGEGSLDTQSLAGKAPIGVAELAARLGVPAVAVAGRIDLPIDRLVEHGIVRGYSLVELAGGVDAAMRDTPRYLSAAGRALARDLEVLTRRAGTTRRLR